MDRAVDILHPLASLEWKRCRGPPVSLDNAKAVWLKDKVYVGGGGASGSYRHNARLYIYTPATDTWNKLDTPVCFFALTTYHYQLVLVGGMKYKGGNVEGELTNALWTLSEDSQWQKSLPPMPILSRSLSAASNGDHLLVTSRDFLNHQVYAHVYNGHHWARTEHPSQKLYSIKSIVFNGHWYLMGTGPVSLSQKTYVYFTSLDSLLASCQPSETSQPSSIWKRLTDIPRDYCHPAVFGNRMVAIGVGSPSRTTSLHAHSSFTQSWIHIDDGRVSSSSMIPCTIYLPSNELMVVRGRTAFKAILKMTPFTPESSFDMRALSLLEAATGISVITTLNDYTLRIQNILGLTTVSNHDLRLLLNYWISNLQEVPPSWKNLLLIIRLLSLDDVAQRMQTYLSGAAEEVFPTRGKQGDEDVDEQLRLKEDTIFRLKQQISNMQQRIEDLTTENEDLKKAQLSSPTIKEEDEEKPVSPLSVMSKFKEEAVIVTKAETTAQSSTATWKLRGVEVCGEMTVVVYSSHDQQITWPGYGLRLNIPKGCLPAGMEQCTINIKASLAGQYEFPENSHLVSAVFWLHCEDVHKFTRLITVDIQHCAKSENVANPLHFIRAVCSQKQLPYTFKLLPGGSFATHSSYGVIELNSFSGVGITQEGSEDREYCLRLFYRGQPNLCKIDFVVTWNIEAYRTVVEDFYEKKGAVVGTEQFVEFEGDSITMDIPQNGMVIKGWKIMPLTAAVVTKGKVDNFREGKMIPHCELKAEVSAKRKKIPDLNHRILLKGAKQPYNFFTLELPVRDPSSQATRTFGDLAAPEPGPPPRKRSRLNDDAAVTNDEPTIPEIKALLRELRRVANEWEDIGIELDIEEGQLRQINADKGGDSRACLRDMLRMWRSRVVPPPSWSAMADALGTLDHQDIATHLRTKYCQ